jgi:hypothetical protein
MTCHKVLNGHRALLFQKSFVVYSRDIKGLGDDQLTDCPV